jgi:excisionase family DNA binding protein
MNAESSPPRDSAQVACPCCWSVYRYTSKDMSRGIPKLIASAHEVVTQPSWGVTSVTAEARHIARMTRSSLVAPDDPSKVVTADTLAHRADAGHAWGSLIHGLLEHAMRHHEASYSDLYRLAMWANPADVLLGNLTLATSPEYEALIDAQEAAILLACSPRTVRRMAESGEIPAMKIGNRWRLSRRRLAKWCEERLSSTQCSPCPKRGVTQ